MYSNSNLSFIFDGENMTKVYTKYVDLYIYVAERIAQPPYCFNLNAAKGGHVSRGFPI